MKRKDIPILIEGIKIYTEEAINENGYIKIRDEKIEELGTMDQLEKEAEYEVLKVPQKYNAVPGFIDVHIHGVNGADVMDATVEALDIMTATLPQEGTTSFLATTMTQETAQIESALANGEKYIRENQTPGKAEILGMHLEGPFVNAKRAGAQPVQYILDPDIEVFKKWQHLAGGAIKLVTIAPERPGGLEMTRYLKAEGIIASIGHTDATFEEIDLAIDAGANHVTHLFNQMRELHHREPGTVGAAFLRNELIAEIIADGIHVRPEMVNLAYKLKKKERLMLITDSMRAKCLKNGQYDLGGQEVTVKDGKAVLEGGTLAGSILKMGQAVKNIVKFTSCPLAAAIEMASVNPAMQLNLYNRKGSIAAGKDADIVILDENLDVFMTFCRGKLAYHKEEKQNENH